MELFYIIDIEIKNIKENCQKEDLKLEWIAYCLLYIIEAEQ